MIKMMIIFALAGRAERTLAFSDELGRAARGKTPRTTRTLSRCCPVFATDKRPPSARAI